MEPPSIFLPIFDCSKLLSPSSDDDETGCNLLELDSIVRFKRAVVESGGKMSGTLSTRKKSCGQPNAITVSLRTYYTVVVGV